MNSPARGLAAFLVLAWAAGTAWAAPEPSGQVVGTWHLAPGAKPAQQRQ